MGIESPLFNTIQQIMDLTENSTDKSFDAPTRTYVGDAKADVKVYPNSYIFIDNMPGLKAGDIKVQVEDDNLLLISGQRKREDKKEGAKYLKLERRVGQVDEEVCASGEC